MFSTSLDATSFLALFGLPGQYEMLILLVLGLILFGRRLPEVGRSVGRSIVEFKKGIKGIEDDIDEEVDRAKPKSRDQIEDRSRRDTVSQRQEEFSHADAPRASD